MDTAGGNPLFIRSLSAAFRRDPGRASALDVLPSAAASPQSLLRSAVGVEVEALPEAARTVLRLLAAAGRRLSRSALAHLTGWDPAAIESALTDLEGDGLLTPDTAEALHPAVRHAVYFDTPARRRREAHRALADLPDMTTCPTWARTSPGRMRRHCRPPPRSHSAPIPPPSSGG
jgi:predicted ATPase